MRFVASCLVSGLAAGLASHIVSAVAGRAERGRSDLPMHAVAHIAAGDEPDAHQGRRESDWYVGTALHYGASVFWAGFFETLFGKRAERSMAAAAVGGATVAAAAYVTDYHVVSDRFKPGFEAHLSNRSLLLIYAALAAGFAAAARLRGLYRHQVEDRDERDERGYPQRRPHAMVHPE